MNLVVTVALLPALFHGPSDDAPVEVAAGGTFETLPVRATAAAGSDEIVVLGPDEIAAPTTTTTAPPPTTTTTAAPRRKVVTTTTVAKPKAAPTTTTTAKPKPRPTTTTTVPFEDGTQSGKGTWYDHKPGICAHKSLPFGTVVTVTNTKNGKSVQCTVGDRGPYVDGYVIDLNPQEFEQLAPTSVGVISVRLTW